MASDIRSVMVIGLGRFGAALARELTRLGYDVVGVDEDIDKLEELAPELASSLQSSCSSPTSLEQLGVRDVDAVVVAMGSDIEASVLITMHLVELDVQRIWAKAVNASHQKILQRVGAHKVILPEVDAGRAVAHRLPDRVHDYFTIGYGDVAGFALAEIEAPPSLYGRTLADADLRRTAEVTVVSVRVEGENWAFAAAHTVIEPGSFILVAGEPDRIDRFVRAD